MRALEAVLVWGGLLVCALVVVGCICRADLLKVDRDGRAWPLVFLLFGADALGVAIDLLHGRLPNWYEAAGLAGVLIYLHLTRTPWRAGLPEVLRRPHEGE